MCREIRKFLPNCQVIFVSGYSDKDYLMGAIDLHAVQYVEKPVHIPELTKAVRSAIETAKQNQLFQQQQVVVNQSFVLQKVLSSSYFGQPVDQETIAMAGLEDLHCASLRAGIIKVSTPVDDPTTFTQNLEQEILSLKENLTFVISFLDKRHYLFLLEGNAWLEQDEEPRLRKILFTLSFQRQGFGKQFTALGTSVSTLDQLPASFSSAQKCLPALFYKGYGSFAFPNTPQCTQFRLSRSDLLSLFSQTLQQNDQEKATAMLQEMVQQVRREHIVDCGTIRNIMAMLDAAVYKEYSRFSSQKIDLVDYSVLPSTQFDTIGQFATYLSHQIQRLNDLRKSNSGDTVQIRKVIQLLHENFADPNLCVNDLAKAVFLTPTYLSNLFKRKTGKSISHALLEIRMEKAKELLQNPAMKLYQIASAVGYKDPNYFAKIFKQQVGTTPSQYREKVL